MKYLWINCLLMVCFHTNFAQVHSAKINYERKTNLEKKYAKDDWVKNYLQEVGKNKIDYFELYINDTCSAFYPTESDVRESLWWATEKNTVWQNFTTKQLFAKRSIWGEEVYVTDTLHIRKWKITDDKRKICGFNCRMAVWQADSGYTMYAWFAPDLLCSTGPESYNGLPGTILGLAKEDGSVTYFATSVTVQPNSTDKMAYPVKRIKYKTIANLREEIAKTYSRDKMYKELVKGYFTYW
ncbi:MAG: GLPGLI family protein [Bacteroidia bacterium]|nr:GLPGLI family protein [Bacteroidia bacterium]